MRPLWKEGREAGTNMGGNSWGGGGVGEKL